MLQLARDAHVSEPAQESQLLTAFPAFTSDVSGH
jgi:hypothetical protein